MSSLSETQQKSSPGDFLQLFVLDATALGGTVLRFVLGAGDIGATVTWQGEVYTAAPVEAEGFEVNGQGSLPTPKIKIANINGALQGMIRDHGDLVGALVTRTRVFAQNLDGASEADPTAHYPPDIYRVERKIAMNKIYVEWELSAALDQQGVMLPRRQVLRDYCDKRYRFWGGSVFDYTKATCPYTGSACFNTQGNPVGAADDRCGKRLSDCKLRFGVNAVLPYGGFPGVARVRPRG
jgi:lambda family phage minor tail protein L